MTVRWFGLLGDPVSHSLSPALYRAAFDYLGAAAHYRAIRVEAGDRPELEAQLRDLSATGGGNITVPHKELAAELVDWRSAAVEETGACNCFWLDTEGRLAGDNTDVAGFLAAADGIDGPRLEGARVLLLGAGGAARAVAVACASAGAASLGVCNRSVERARGLIDDLGLGDLATLHTAESERAQSWDVVINATSLGLRSQDPLPLTLDVERHRFAFDLVYGPGGTNWTRHAEGAGIPAIDGLTMLISQAVESLSRWFGQPTDVDGIARVMRQAVT
ncbi:MAG: shikimate dehydrogenase [marine benthic group bacterium]|jgi:shikimate dehydrogenase|nr:shikimate dehydrogenase [Candidatus Benthicola marisminoris]